MQIHVFYQKYVYKKHEAEADSENQEDNNLKESFSLSCTGVCRRGGCRVSHSTFAKAVDCSLACW